MISHKPADSKSAGYSIKYSYASYEGSGADLGYDDLYHRNDHFCCGSSNDTY